MPNRSCGPPLEGDHVELVASQPLGLGGRAHPGGVPADHHHPLGHADQAKVVRISVPARTALVTGVFSAISASLARWSSPRAHAG
jgi:hypothetical protein